MGSTLVAAADGSTPVSPQKGVEDTASRDAYGARVPEPEDLLEAAADRRDTRRAIVISLLSLLTVLLASLLLFVTEPFA